MTEFARWKMRFSNEHMIWLDWEREARRKFPSAQYMSFVSLEDARE